MRILVTGASGFLGRNLLLSFPKHYQIYATYLNSVDFPTFLREHQLGQVTALRIDLAQPNSGKMVAKHCCDFDCCVFLAANGDPAVSVTNPALDLSSNTLSMLSLLESVSVQRFLFFSSGAVYDGLKGPVDPSSVLHPLLPYAISKLTSETYVRFFEKLGKIQESVCIRFFGAYGPFEPNRKIYTKLVRQFAIQKNPHFILRGDGKNLIDAMHVSDMVRAVHSIIHKTTPSLVLDLYSSSPKPLINLVEEAASIFGLKAEIEQVGDVPEYIEFYSQDKTIENIFGFTPQVSLRDGLLKMYEYLL